MDIFGEGIQLLKNDQKVNRVQHLKNLYMNSN